MKTSRSYSISPSGEKFPLPTAEDYEEEFARLKKLAARQRRQKREIVVVVGVGFVGAVMAAVVADARDKAGRRTKFVIGMQRPSTRSFWKIPLLNRGVSPVKAEDPEVERLIARCVKKKKTLVATYTDEVAEAGRRGGGGRAVRLPQGVAGQRAHGRRRHGRAGELDGAHRRAHPAPTRWS